MSQSRLVPVNRYSSTSQFPAGQGGVNLASSPAPPLLEIQHLIFREAVRLGASDIHIEPVRRQTRVRYRIDGLMLHTLELPRWIHEQLIARFKVMAAMDITERRLPQDGHIVDDAEGIDGRLSTMPTDGGEAVVVRIFRDRQSLPTITGLGASTAIETQLKAISQRPQGSLIVAGPTGSGKTTTLYAIIDELRRLPLNVVTIEDPIEYRVDGVRQVQVDQKSQLTFHRALRSLLRQDPDVILVGEIRDSETAHIAFEAALTGHLVLSTLHAIDAPSILLRLAELGVDSNVVASALIGAVAQRLVRCNCEGCVQPDFPAEFYLERLGIQASETFRLRRSGGCAECRFTGTKGRMPLFEILELNRQTRTHVVSGNEAELRRVATNAGFVPILDQVRDQVLTGVVAVDEAYRTCYFGDVS